MAAMRTFLEVGGDASAGARAGWRTAPRRAPWRHDPARAALTMRPVAFDPPASEVIGFSTACFTPGTAPMAVLANQAHDGNAVELASTETCQLDELELARTELADSKVRVSVHAPRFRQGVPADIAERLAAVDLPLVVETDWLARPERWRSLGDRLLVKNTASTQLIYEVFRALPTAALCLDVSLAFTTGGLSLIRALASRYAHRLAQVSVGSVDMAHAPSDADLVHMVFDAAGRTAPVIVERRMTSMWSHELTDRMGQLRQVAQLFQIRTYS